MFTLFMFTFLAFGHDFPQFSLLYLCFKLDVMKNITLISLCKYINCQFKYRT